MTTTDHQRTTDEDIAAMKNDLRTFHEDMRAVTRKVDILQDWVTENSQVTRDVRDLLSTFRISGAVAKWVAVVMGAIAGSVAVAKGWIGK